MNEPRSEKALRILAKIKAKRLRESEKDRLKQGEAVEAARENYGPAPLEGVQLPARKELPAPPAPKKKPKKVDISLRRPKRRGAANIAKFEKKRSLELTESHKRKQRLMGRDLDPGRLKPPPRLALINKRRTSRSAASDVQDQEKRAVIDWADDSYLVQERGKDVLALEALIHELPEVDKKPLRNAVAYRIVRALLHFSGAEPSDHLMEILPSLEHWVIPLKRFDNSPETYRKVGSLGLIREYLANYQPVSLFLHEDTHPQLRANTEKMVVALTKALDLKNTLFNVSPAAGRVALAGLADNWPNPLELVEYEQDLLYELHTRIVDNGKGPTHRTHLVLNMGLKVWEADHLMQRAMRRASELSQNYDIDAERQIQLERIEGMNVKANSIADLKTQVQIGRQAATIGGILRAPAGDGEGDFYEMARRVDAEEQEDLKVLDTDYEIIEGN